MRTISLLLVLATTPFAGEMKPYLMANAGLTMPSVDIDELGDAKLEEVNGYSATIGIGARMPMNPQIDIDGSIGLSLVAGGVTLKETYTDSRYYTSNVYPYNSGYYDVTETSTYEATLFPKLLDLSGSVVYHATPQISVGGGLVFSIPMGGTYERSMEYESVSECPTTASYCAESESYSDEDDGDLDDIFDDADTKPKSFASLKLEGEYLVNERLSVTGAFLMPLGDYISEEGNTVTWSRATVGIKYAFSMPQATAAKAAPATPVSAPAPAAPAADPTPAPAAPAQP